jgi:hypothetical protein
MLTPGDVKPFVVHEDLPVRDAALDYFRGTWSHGDARKGRTRVDRSDITSIPISPCNLPNATE